MEQDLWAVAHQLLLVSYRDYSCIQLATLWSVDSWNRIHSWECWFRIDAPRRWYNSICRFLALRHQLWLQVTATPIVDAESSSSSTAPFTLGESLSYPTSENCSKILKGVYVDMAELLRDNVKMEQRQQQSQSSDGWTGTCTSRRG